MAGIESEGSTEVTGQIFGNPFQRATNPQKEYWSLTQTAQSRIAANNLPPHLSEAQRAALHLLSVNGPSEEDELADWLNLSNQAMHKVMTDLQSYDYVALNAGGAQTV